MAIGDEIRAMKEACENMPKYQRNDCPECGYQLEEKDGQFHCRFCGWTSR